jgi:hypothetical protein
MSELEAEIEEQGARRSPRKHGRKEQDVDLSSYDEYSSLQKFSNLEQMAQDVILLENTLNADQKLFYNAICDLLDGKVATTNINSNFFLDGPGDLNLT